MSETFSLEPEIDEMSALLGSPSSTLTTPAQSTAATPQPSTKELDDTSTSAPATPASTTPTTTAPTTTTTPNTTAPPTPVPPPPVPEAVVDQLREMAENAGFKRPAVEQPEQRPHKHARQDLHSDDKFEIPIDTTIPLEENETKYDKKELTTALLRNRIYQDFLRNPHLEIYQRYNYPFVDPDIDPNDTPLAFIHTQQDNEGIYYREDKTYYFPGKKFIDQISPIRRFPSTVPPQSSPRQFSSNQVESFEKWIKKTLTKSQAARAGNLVKDLQDLALPDQAATSSSELPLANHDVYSLIFDINYKVKMPPAFGQQPDQHKTLLQDKTTFYMPRTTTKVFIDEQLAGHIREHVIRIIASQLDHTDLTRCEVACDPASLSFCSGTENCFVPFTHKYINQYPPFFTQYTGSRNVLAINLTISLLNLNEHFDAQYSGFQQPLYAIPLFMPEDINYDTLLDLYETNVQASQPLKKALPNPFETYYDQDPRQPSTNAWRRMITHTPVGICPRWLKKPDLVCQRQTSRGLPYVDPREVCRLMHPLFAVKPLVTSSVPITNVYQITCPIEVQNNDSFTRPLQKSTASTKTTRTRSTTMPETRIKKEKRSSSVSSTSPAAISLPIPIPTISQSAPTDSAPPTHTPPIRTSNTHGLTADTLPPSTPFIHYNEFVQTHTRIKGQYLSFPTELWPQAVPYTPTEAQGIFKTIRKYFRDHNQTNFLKTDTPQQLFQRYEKIIRHNPPQFFYNQHTHCRLYRTANMDPADFPQLK